MKDDELHLSIVTFKPLPGFLTITKLGINFTVYLNPFILPSWERWLE